MKFLFDLFPVILFFVTYKLGKLHYHLSEEISSYWATAILMAASVVQIASIYLMRKKPQTLHWITLAIAIPLGTTTLLLREKIIFQWKPTILDAAMGAIFIGSLWFGERTMIERLMGKAIKLPAQVWRNLNVAWSVFFFACAALNLVVVYRFSYDAWVNFKLFGLMGLTFVFAFGQIFFLQKYIVEEELAKKAAENQNTPPAA